MEIEHSVKVIPIDDPVRFQQEVEKLAAEGWATIPGIVPVAVYHVVRAKGAAPMVGVGANVQLHVDDSKIHIIKPDGSIQ